MGLADITIHEAILGAIEEFDRLGRSDGSIEFKHCNISAALGDLGIPYIDGYKPRPNLQAALAELVADRVDADGELIELVGQRADAAPQEPRPLSLVEPPERGEEREQAVRTRRPVRIDFQKREARNRALGAGGEEAVLRYEIDRLTAAGRGDLAGRVEHVS